MLLVCRPGVSMKISNKLFRAGPARAGDTHTHNGSHGTQGKTQAHRGHGLAEHTHSTLRHNLTTKTSQQTKAFGCVVRFGQFCVENPKYRIAQIAILRLSAIGSLRLRL